ncbi:MAG: hypothetical protein ACLP29_01295 [Dissulfurispiraceae bacterium]
MTNMFSTARLSMIGYGNASAEDVTCRVIILETNTGHFIESRNMAICIGVAKSYVTTILKERTGHILPPHVKFLSFKNCKYFNSSFP